MPIIAIVEPAAVPDGVLAAQPDLEAAVSAVQATPGDVVLVSRTEPGRRTARATRLVLGAEHVGLLHIPVPATRFYALAAALAQLQDTDLGLTPSVADAAGALLRTQVLLSSVTSLEDPSPRMGQHLASLWPPSRFLLDWDARTLRRTREIPVIDGGLRVVAESAVALNLPDPPWSEADVEIHPDERLWPSSRWIEVTTLTAPLGDAAHRVAAGSVHQASCPACGRRGSGPTCVFCAVVLDLPALAATVPATPGENS
ncbi:MAG: hypothetical protein ACTMIR_02230 [Cellulomonadaceae bacterium]